VRFPPCSGSAKQPAAASGKYSDNCCMCLEVLCCAVAWCRASLDLTADQCHTKDERSNDALHLANDLPFDNCNVLCVE
jgi:hypothetical protein